MTWIKTVPLSEADEKLVRAMQDQRALYPAEYATPVFPTDDGASGIVSSHSLIPEALHHAFATFGALMSPDLPLSRRQEKVGVQKVLAIYIDPIRVFPTPCG